MESIWKSFPPPSKEFSGFVWRRKSGERGKINNYNQQFFKLKKRYLKKS